jgi:hypothetical protein
MNDSPDTPADAATGASSGATSHTGHWTTASDVVVQRLGDAMVIVQLQTDAILELNETAARLVELLTDGKTVEEAVEALAGEYAANVEDVRKDVQQTLASLAAEQVLEPKRA